MSGHLCRVYTSTVHVHVYLVTVIVVPQWDTAGSVFEIHSCVMCYTLLPNVTINLILS